MIRKHKQRGVAIITALLVVMLAASIAAFLLAQQSQALTRTVRTGERAQALLYAQPTLDWARAALFELQKNTARVDLSQPWAKGLSAIPIDGAIAAGRLRDEAGLFNVNNLVKDDGTQSVADVELLRALLSQLKLNPDLASAVADWIDADDEATLPGGAENATYLARANPYRAANQRLLQISELHRVQGFNDEIIGRLSPFITALPGRTRLNINTVPQELLAAAFPALANDDIVALMKYRLATPFTRIDGESGLKSYLKTVPASTIDKFFDCTSRYFSASIAINNGGTQIRQSALLQRSTGEGAAVDRWPSIIWVKSE